MLSAQPGHADNSNEYPHDAGQRASSSGTECAACWSPDPEKSEDVACAGVSTSECDCNSHAREHACVRVCVHSSVRSVCVCVCARVCASVCSCEDEEADDGEGRVVPAEMLEDDATSRD